MRNIEDYVTIRLAVILGVIALLYLFLGSCVTGVPEADDLRAQQIEQERKELYVLWKRMCLEAGGYILVNRSWSCGTNDRDCIPDKSEWNGEIITRNGRNKLISHSITYQCVRRH